MSEVNTAKFQRGPDYRGKDADAIVALHGQAVRYIESWEWCPPIATVHLAFASGGAFAVFVITFAEGVEETDEDQLWVVTGDDLPSAYLVTEEAPDAWVATMIYGELMQDWVDAVVARQPLDEVYPVEMAPTAANAAALHARLDHIRDVIAPMIAAGVQ
jgi:hypothetical protein